jgi:hypothetical protein
LLLPVAAVAQQEQAVLVVFAADRLIRFLAVRQLQYLLEQVDQEAQQIAAAFRLMEMILRLAQFQRLAAVEAAFTQLAAIVLATVVLVVRQELAVVVEQEMQAVILQLRDITAAVLHFLIFPLAAVVALAQLVRMELLAAVVLAA